MSIDDDVARVFALWDAGRLSNGEVSTCLVELLTPTNIDDVVRAVPERFRTDFVSRLHDISGEGPLISIFAGIYNYEVEPDPIRRSEMKAAVDREQALSEEHFERVVRPAIRDWIRKHP